MIIGKLSNQGDDNKKSIPHVMQTNNIFERMRGLLGRKPLSPDQALLITSCSSIHTFFMQYPIDLAFLNKDWQIKKIIHALKPFRLAWVPGASMVLEMPSGSIDKFNLKEKTILVWEDKK